MRDPVDMNVIANALVERAAEMVRGKEPRYGSVTITFSPASDTLNCRVETNIRLTLKGLTKKR
jgi:hypothetical protein